MQSLLTYIHLFLSSRWTAVISQKRRKRHVGREPIMWKMSRLFQWLKAAPGQVLMSFPVIKEWMFSFFSSIYSALHSEILLCIWWHLWYGPKGDWILEAKQLGSLSWEISVNAQMRGNDITAHILMVNRGLCVKEWAGSILPRSGFLLFKVTLPGREVTSNWCLYEKWAVSFFFFLVVFFTLS